MTEENRDRPRHLIEDFDLPIDDLRAADGALDAGRIAAALGVPTDSLLRAVSVKQSAADRVSDSEDGASQLESYASVIGMVRDFYGGDQTFVTAWLETPHRDLDGKTPLGVLTSPGGATIVEQWISGPWLGIPD